MPRCFAAATMSAAEVPGGKDRMNSAFVPVNASGAAGALLAAAFAAPGFRPRGLRAAGSDWAGRPCWTPDAAFAPPAVFRGRPTLPRTTALPLLPPPALRTFPTRLPVNSSPLAFPAWITSATDKWAGSARMKSEADCRFPPRAAAPPGAFTRFRWTMLSSPSCAAHRSARTGVFYTNTTQHHLLLHRPGEFTNRDEV
jgi:hypothetical protein